MWVTRNAKARPTATPIAVWLIASSSSEGLINADRFLGRTGLTSGMSCVFADNCSRSANCLARSIRSAVALQSKHAPVRITDPFIIVAHVIGSFCADNVLDKRQPHRHH